MRIRGSSPAVRVAAVATAAIAVVYVIGAIVLNLVVARHMTQQGDDRLGSLRWNRQIKQALCGCAKRTFDTVQVRGERLVGRGVGQIHLVQL